MESGSRLLVGRGEQWTEGDSGQRMTVDRVAMDSGVAVGRGS